MEAWFLLWVRPDTGLVQQPGAAKDWWTDGQRKSPLVPLCERGRRCHHSEEVPFEPPSQREQSHLPFRKRNNSSRPFAKGANRVPPFAKGGLGDFPLLPQPARLRMTAAAAPTPPGGPDRFACPKWFGPGSFSATAPAVRWERSLSQRPLSWPRTRDRACSVSPLCCW